MNWRDIIWRRNGYQLEYRVRSPGDTPDTGWYLYGPKGFPFGDYMGKTLSEAKTNGDAYIVNRGLLPEGAAWEELR